MAHSLRPHRHFNFVGLWKKGYILSAVLICLAIIGFVVSGVTTGFPLTLGTEFSGGTSIQISNAEGITEDDLSSTFESTASDLGYDMQISSIQTSSSAGGGDGFIIKTTNTVSTEANEIMEAVESELGIDGSYVEIETIGASWGASVVWRSILAFLISCLAILLVISLRYRDPRMGIVALLTLFHDMIIVLGIYAWAGMFMNMEITSDVIAALLAIIGYSLYDTIVVFHRINRNASPQMKCSLKTCANSSLNEIIVRSMNTSITSILPVLFMLILGTDTLRDFAFAMFCGMIVGFYSTLAISAPLYTLWKCKDPAYARLEKKYPYEVVQSPFTKKMLLQARQDKKELANAEKAEQAARKKEEAAQQAAKNKKGATAQPDEDSDSAADSTTASRSESEVSKADTSDGERADGDQAPEPEEDVKAELASESEEEQ